MKKEKNQSMNSRLFERAKSIFRTAKASGKVDKTSFEQLEDISKEFGQLDDQIGVAFCHKAKTIMHLINGSSERDRTVRLECYSMALWEIKHALVVATSIGWNQPSLGKWYGMTQVKLADAMHRIGNHEEADQMMNEGLETLTKTLEEFDDYIPGEIAYAEALVAVNYWAMKKTLIRLKGARFLATKGQEVSSKTNLGFLLKGLNESLKSYPTVF